MPKKNKESTKQAFRLDGRTLEGGGQLLRLAVGLSALTGQALHVEHIRGNRRGGGGGLKAQHLACVKWLGEACHAEVKGAHIKSTELLFEPGGGGVADVPAYNHRSVVPGNNPEYTTRIDIGSPGSVGLALQAVLPFILMCPPSRSRLTTQNGGTVALTIVGGTNVSNSPSYEYLSQVLFPTLALIGLPVIKSSLAERGWSTGGPSIGSVTFTIATVKPGDKLPAIVLEPPDHVVESGVIPSRIVATVLAPSSMWDRFEACLHSTLRKVFGKDAEDSGKEHGKLEIVFEDSQNEQRIYLILVATVTHAGIEHKLGSDELFQGSKKQSRERLAEDMVARVAVTLATDIRSGACVDRHMADQLVVFQALAEGKSNVWRGTPEAGQALGQSLHAETAEWITGEMMGAGLRNGRGRGVGLEAKGGYYNCDDSGDFRRHE